jgi:hypothetical protein
MTPPSQVAFLFLGETLLMPHLYPIVEALAAAEADLAIDLWVSTGTHEALLSSWLPAAASQVRIRRAPGFRDVQSSASGRNPDLPPKLPMLARLAPALARTRVCVCAEQTSLWLPTLLPMRARFVKTSHGVGSMSARDDRRRRAAWRTLVPSERERATYLARGMDPGRIVATGYVKAGFRQRRVATNPFADTRPVVLYTPHWQRHRSSWWTWGAELVRRIVDDGRYNLIFAPHQRLLAKAPEMRALAAELADRPELYCDFDSFAGVDGSYTALADIYLGDTSSQVIEFLSRPRPSVFLNSGAAAWKDDPNYTMWRCGTVVDRLEEVLPALAAAPSEHVRFADLQAWFATDSLGDTSWAPGRAATEVLDALCR